MIPTNICAIIPAISTPEAADMLERGLVAKILRVSDGAEIVRLGKAADAAAWHAVGLRRAIWQTGHEDDAYAERDRQNASYRSRGDSGWLYVGMA